MVWKIGYRIVANSVLLLVAQLLHTPQRFFVSVQRVNEPDWNCKIVQKEKEQSKSEMDVVRCCSTFYAVISSEKFLAILLSGTVDFKANFVARLKEVDAGHCNRSVAQEEAENCKR